MFLLLGKFGAIEQSTVLDQWQSVEPIRYWSDRGDSPQQVGGAESCLLMIGNSIRACLEQRAYIGLDPTCFATGRVWCDCQSGALDQG